MDGSRYILIAILIVLVAIMAIAAYAVFGAGDDTSPLPTAYPSLEPSGCSEGCQRATSISGTNQAIETAVQETATAFYVEATLTAESQ